MKKRGGGKGFGDVPKPDSEDRVISKAEHQTTSEPWEDQESRIAALLGVGDPEECPFNEAILKFYSHLRDSLELPCDVTGIEDFRWEERYIFGPPKPREYERLRKKQPSFRDTFELLSIEQGAMSKWMLFADEDIGANVRRKSDGKKFCLGLAELEVINQESHNHQLLDDYVMYFVNYR